MSYFILALLFVSSAFATLERISIQNLDVGYTYPYGTGEFEKLTLGAELVPTKFPVEFYRRDASFEIISPFVTFEYLNPSPMIHNIQNVTVKSLYLDLNYKNSSVKANSIHLTGENTGEVILDKVDFSCSGNSVMKDPIDRLKEDCVEKMSAKATHMVLPFEVVKSIANELPDEETEIATEMPADDFSITMTKGDFYSYVRIKILIRAYLKIWGHVQYEDAGLTTAIRVDTIKFGILPVTSLVMNILRREISSESVIVDPPWIRIKSGK
jgi:hypothetical protein